MLFDELRNPLVPLPSATEIHLEAHGVERTRWAAEGTPGSPTAAHGTVDGGGAEGGGGSGGHRRILVVDDNRDSADALAELLELVGHVTAVAYDGESALVVADEFAPDVVLLDIGLPVIDGYELARLLRERLDRRPLLVAVTGYGQDDDRDRAEEAGFDHHLLKPVDLEKLRGLLG